MFNAMSRYFLFSSLVKRTVATINSLEELENQTEIKYGVLRGGSLQKFFQNSGDQLYRRMFSHMREYDTAVNCTAEGVEKARTEQYAYLTEQPFLEYYNHQKCNTRLLNNLLQSQAYGIGLQKDSEYTNEISVAILKVSSHVNGAYLNVPWPAKGQNVVNQSILQAKYILRWSQVDNCSKKVYSNGLLSYAESSSVFM